MRVVLEGVYYSRAGSVTGFTVPDLMAPINRVFLGVFFGFEILVLYLVLNSVLVFHYSVSVLDALFAPQSIVKEENLYILQHFINTYRKLALSTGLPALDYNPLLLTTRIFGQNLDILVSKNSPLSLSTLI